MSIIKNRKFRFILAVCLIIILIPVIFYLSVAVSIWPEDYFWVERKNAIMPVWVEGNIDSGVFIIFNHGGPGSSGTLESRIEVGPANGKLDHPSPLKILEKDYAMVYWDQRHQGMSKGTADPNDSQPEDFGNDLDIVIQTLKDRYEIKKIFLIGQSWGHFVAACYMTYVNNWQENQSNIAGYICYKGNHGFGTAYNSVRPKMMAYAKSQIQKKQDTAYWQNVYNFYQENKSVMDISNVSQHYEYIYKVMGATHSFYDRVISSTKESLFSPFNGLDFYSNFRKTSQAKKFNEWVWSSLGMRDVIHRIKVPTLLVYGRKDLNAPVEVGQVIYNEIETPEQNKELLVLENSRHGAENEDVLIFQNAIKNFINKYR